MNWDAIGALAELLGAAAVLVTIVYLARQIKQNSDIARVEAFRDMQKQWSEMRERTMQPENLSLINRGMQGIDKLDESEKPRFHKLMGDEFAFLDTVMLMERRVCLMPSTGWSKTLANIIVICWCSRESWNSG